jgi:3-hydroxyacyl-[acyl-carrier-protein] dehydratase
VKIPSSEVGKEIFKNVSTLTSYIAEHVGSASGETASPASGSAASPDPLAHLPHADPFRFVTGVTSVTPGESAEGTWSVSGNEDFFRGHFPGNPLVPGVLLAEALAQISGIAGTTGAGVAPKAGMLAHVDVRFDKPVAPPATVVLRAKLATAMGSLQKFDVAAEVNGVVVASGSITLHRGG